MKTFFLELSFVIYLVVAVRKTINTRSVIKMPYLLWDNSKGCDIVEKCVRKGQEEQAKKPRLLPHRPLVQ